MTEIDLMESFSRRIIFICQWQKVARLGAILCHSKAESETSTHLTERQKKFIKFLGITNFIKRALSILFLFIVTFEGLTPRIFPISDGVKRTLAKRQS